MNATDIRKQIHVILDNHDDALSAIRTAHTAMQAAFTAHDEALVAAILANRAVLQLLNRLLDEGVEGE
jgi:hypothetical protein